MADEPGIFNTRGMNRREFIRTAAGALIGASLFGRWSFSAEVKPNFIYILLDDAGYGDFSCYGQKLFETPNIDRVAAEGVMFTDHYSGSTVCAPSRCCLLTGMHTGHAPIRDNRGALPEGQTPLPADSVTIPKLLKQAGYATGAFGKWGLGPPGSTGDPLNQGFDEFFGFNCQTKAHNYYPLYMWHNTERVELDEKTYAHDLIVDKAFEFIRNHKDGPFFCYLPVTIPHASLHVPEKWSKPFRNKFKKFNKKLGIYEGPVITNPPACFAGMMTRLDAQVGDLLALLDDLGIDDNTYVFITSDNGPHEEGGAMPELFDSNGPFRGIKRDLYEGGIRVPMIARRPGVITAGAKSAHVSAFWDVMPTFCELAGARAPGGIDGVSFAPTLLGRKQDQKQHEYLYWEFPSRDGRQAARAGNWKAVRLDVAENPDAPVELYDLAADPGETTNIAAAHPDVAARMLGIMKSARAESDDFRLFR